jgi:hypothetical protein
VAITPCPLHFSPFLGHQRKAHSHGSPATAVRCAAHVLPRSSPKQKQAYSAPQPAPAPRSAPCMVPCTVPMVGCSLHGGSLHDTLSNRVVCHTTLAHAYAACAFAAHPGNQGNCQFPCKHCSVSTLLRLKVLGARSAEHSRLSLPLVVPAGWLKC